MDNTFQILVLEDNLSTKEVLKKTFSRLGCQVTFAESSEDGISQLLKAKFDAVFAELCIRGERGARGLARWVKCQFPHTKFFILTSWKGDLEYILLAHDGIHDIIRKPLIFSEVRDKLLEHLG